MQPRCCALPPRYIPIQSRRDCAVSAAVLGFGVAQTGVYQHAPTATSGDRYDLVLLANAHIEIRRVRGGVVTVLGDVASGLTNLGASATLSLSASGAGPVTLVAAVNGATRLTVSDGSSAALVAAGFAGLFTSNAGVVFDDFTLVTAGTGGSPPPPDMSAPAPDLASPTSFGLRVDFTDTTHALLAVDSAGTSYAIALAADGTQLLASTDGRSWSARGTHAAGGFFVMSALADGTLIADTTEASGHVLARSTDHGATWTDVLALGQFKMLTPHSIAELDGTTYMLEYQTFTGNDTPIALHASTDGGASWTTRFVFQGHRHGHGVIADANQHLLWTMFGDTDAQSGIYLSSNAGASWQLLLGNQDGDVVDATVLAGGAILFGQDISFLPPKPAIATLDRNGTYNIIAPILGPSYSIHALAGGGFVVGSERENGGDIYPTGDVSARVYGSPDGKTWQDLLDYPWADPNAELVRADVYWELPSTGELVLNLVNAAGFGAGGQGYQLLQRTN